jgi:hypothetical protein
MECYDLDGFLRISALLNYQLSAKQLNWNNITFILLEGKTIAPRDETVLHHGLHPPAWIKYVRVVGRIIPSGEKGSCHEATEKVQPRVQTSSC